MFFSWKHAVNEQTNRTPTVLWNATDRSCKLLLYYKEAPLQMFNVKIFWNFDTGVQKNIFYFLPDFSGNCSKNNSKLIKENENHITKWTAFDCKWKNMEHIKTTVVVFHSLWPMIPFNVISYCNANNWSLKTLQMITQLPSTVQLSYSR